LPQTTPKSAEVVIVGGGAMGTSVAYHLAKLGMTDVVLLERESLASGSTSKSAGGIRAQFTDELNVRIALRSMTEFQALDRVSGIEYRRDGYLFLLDREEDVESFRQAVAMQQALGVPSQLVTPDDVKAMNPALETGDLLAAAYCPIDGHASPESVVQAYAGAAGAQGVRILQGTTLERVAVLGDKVVSVETSAGRIRTGTVVCTAGVWSRDVGTLAGLDIPVEGEARWMHFTPENGGLPDPFPFTIDFSTGFYFHREGAGLVFGGREPTIEGVAGRAARRLPVLAELPIQSSWWGWYEMSPDHNAIVGEAAQPRRFLYATGFSGHGFQQSPAVGEHLAELVAGREPTLDLSPLRLERFAGGGERREQFVV
jgi:sarcosine oxidase, subunit beta